MGQGAIDGLTFVTVPSCCLSPRPPGVWPALLVLVTPSNPALFSPMMCIFFTSPPLELPWMGGGGGSLP